MARDNPSFPVPTNSKDTIFSFGSTREQQLSDIILAFNPQCLQAGDTKAFDDFVNGDKFGTVFSNDDQCDILYGSGSFVCSVSCFYFNIFASNNPRDLIYIVHINSTPQKQ